VSFLEVRKRFLGSLPILSGIEKAKEEGLQRDSSRKVIRLASKPFDDCETGGRGLGSRRLNAVSCQSQGGSLENGN